MCFSALFSHYSASCSYSLSLARKANACYIKIAASVISLKEEISADILYGILSVCIRLELKGSACRVAGSVLRRKRTDRVKQPFILSFFALIFFAKSP
jgi:hypothetical protein